MLKENRDEECEKESMQTAIPLVMFGNIISFACVCVLKVDKIYFQISRRSLIILILSASYSSSKAVVFFRDQSTARCPFNKGPIIKMRSSSVGFGPSLCKLRTRSTIAIRVPFWLVAFRRPLLGVHRWEKAFVRSDNKFSIANLSSGPGEEKSRHLSPWLLLFSVVMWWWTQGQGIIGCGGRTVIVLLLIGKVLAVLPWP